MYKIGIWGNYVSFLNKNRQIFAIKMEKKILVSRGKGGKGRIEKRC